MFTGIVEEVGRLKSIQKNTASAVLTIGAKHILEDVKLGDSIAVNGICLTVTRFTGDSFTVDVMHETMNRSSIGKLSMGSSVNLERAMPANGRFGGHIVSGHIDGTGKIISIQKDDNAIWYTIAAEQKLLAEIIEKGSIAIDGISLTVAKKGQDTFEVSIIPHTVKNTILGDKKVNDIVNLETDCIGKYVRQFLLAGQAAEDKKKKSNITLNQLLENGF